MAWTKEERAEYNRKWRAENAEKIKEQKAKYNKENSEKRKASLKAWQKSNPEKLKEIQARCYSKNKESIREVQKIWQKANPDKLKARESRRRENLSNSYVKKVLRFAGFPKESITLELIELKRITLKTSRLCRQLKN